MCLCVCFCFFSFFLHVGKNDDGPIKRDLLFYPLKQVKRVQTIASQLLLHPTTGMSLPERSFHLYPSTSGVSQVFGNCAD